MLGWNAGAGTTAYLRQAAGAPGLNVMSPSWWHLTSDGGVTGSGDRRYVEWARTRSIRVWPLFANGNDPDRTHRVLTDEPKRRALIDRVAALAADVGADGVNVDWENMHTADKDAFSAFIAEASHRWRAAGLHVSVDVTPLTEDWSLGNWSEAYDRRAIGEAADLVVLMAYDQHNRLRPNGPTASLPWVRDSVRALVREVSQEKVVLGVPLYTYDWSRGAARPAVVTVDRAPAFLRDVGARTRWDEQLGLHVATFSRDGREHTIWVEDEQSLERKVALVHEFGLAGVAAWRLGFGTSAAWSVLAGRTVSAPPAASSSPSIAPTQTPPPPVTPSPTAGSFPTPPAAGRRSDPGSAAVALAATAVLALAGTAVIRRARGG